MRGDIYKLAKPKDAMGREQDDERYAVVVQNDDMLLSTLVVCPTSTSASSASIRPEVMIKGFRTRVLVEQISAVAPGRLGARVGNLSLQDILTIEAALKKVLGFLQ